MKLVSKQEQRERGPEEDPVRGCGVGVSPWELGHLPPYQYIFSVTIKY